jgi:hypothetical protein
MSEIANRLRASLERLNKEADAFDGKDWNAEHDRQVGVMRAEQPSHKGTFAELWRRYQAESVATEAIWEEHPEDDWTGDLLFEGVTEFTMEALLVCPIVSREDALAATALLASEDVQDNSFLSAPLVESLRHYIEAGERAA